MVALDGFAPLTGPAFGLSALSGAFFLMASLGLYGAFQRGPVRLVAPIIASFPILSVGWAAFGGNPILPMQWLAVVAIVVGVSVVAALADETAADVPPKARTIAYASISAIGFAGTFAFGQWATVLASDLPVTLVTRIVAIVLLVGTLLWCRLPLWPGARAVPVLALMGLADGIALYCVFSAAHLPNAEYAAVAASIFGLLTIVMAWAILREPMRLPQWIGCGVAFAGIGYLAL